VVAVDKAQYILVRSDSSGGGLRGDLKLAFRVLVIGLLAVGALVAYRWLDSNLLNWGINDGPVTAIDRTELLEKVRAFEVVSVKHTYQATTSVNASKELGAGPAEVPLPGWVAGQKLKVSGDVKIAAGVDLSRLAAEDIEVSRGDAGFRVVVDIPSAQITSRELVPQTLNISTSQGLLTRLKTRLGFNEKDLRDGSLDRLNASAEEAAVSSGILTEAGIEAKARLEAFLNGIASASGQPVSYEIRLKPAPAAE
jgi:hypothetical protein